MSTPLERFAFVDSVIAAEVLQVTQDTVLDWVAAGRLRPFGGKPSNPFFRSADVAALAEELGVGQDQAPKRTKSASARVQARLTADARWSDVGERDLADWLQRADSTRRQAAQTTARIAKQRLETLLRLIDLAEGKSE